MESNIHIGIVGCGKENNEIICHAITNIDLSNPFELDLKDIKKIERLEDCVRFVDNDPKQLNNVSLKKTIKPNKRRRDRK